MTLEKEQVPIPNGPFTFTKDMKDNKDVMGHTIKPDEEFHWVIVHNSHATQRNQLKRLKVANVDLFLDHFQYLFMHNQTPVFASKKISFMNTPSPQKLLQNEGKT